MTRTSLQTIYHAGNKGLHLMQHDQTATSQQGLPPTSVLQKIIIVKQKASLGRICLKSTEKKFIRILEEN
jgi:hypothetical protein